MPHKVYIYYRLLGDVLRTHVHDIGEFQTRSMRLELIGHCAVRASEALIRGAAEDGLGVNVMT